MNENIKKLLAAVKLSKNIVFFGGAGVSTESGIKDFRSKDGLYNLKSKYGVDYETILSHTYYERHKETFFNFYKEFMINLDAKPNNAHKFLAELEKKKNLTIITQNIDGLHQLAGSKNVIELHGSIHRNYCEKCGKFHSLEEILKQNSVPKCECGGDIKPDVVLYEEPLLENSIVKAMIAIQEADLLIIAGTSLRVYPANGLIRYFYGDNIYIINKEKIESNSKIKLQITGSVGEIFKELSDNYDKV